MTTVTAIDVGNTSTVVAGPGGVSRFSSVVWIDPTGAAVAGDTAGHPHLVELLPVRALTAARSTRLAGRSVPTEEFTAVLLRRAWRLALDGRPDPTATDAVLTHPGHWHTDEVGALRRAADLAGIPSPRFVPAPVAAVVGCRGDLPVRPGDLVGVLDVGGRTASGAVVVAAGSEPRVVAATEPDLVGGADLDDALRRLVHEHADVRGDTGGTSPEGPEVTRWREHLSDATTVQVTRPEWPEPLLVTRREFDERVEPTLHAVAALVDQAVDLAGTSADRLAAVLLVGGVAATPALSDLVAERLGRLPVRAADPALAVALGARGVVSAPRPRRTTEYDPFDLADLGELP
ncbi:Hsp70 family protein [Micromonospora sp. NPDC000207]|uniref:Hsp70 family protein n=1 Tax=Micromonospora sp. NPDC000207 TaxID=3154246 RepID=UPI00332E207F